jgi:hypothetical protein
VPAVPDVHQKVVDAGKALKEADRPKAAGEINQRVAAEVSQKQEWGGLAGRLVLAMIVTLIVSQRQLIRMFLFPGLLAVLFTFGYAVHQSQRTLEIGIALAGFFTVAQFSFWGNYLPRVYPLHLRGTGESFAANIGGRMIGTSFALVTSELSMAMPGATDAAKMAAAATAVGAFVYVANIILSFWLPEPERAELPDEI